MREEEKKQSSQTKGNFFKKRWVYPAIYLASAALIITAIFWYQSIGNNSAKDDFKYKGEGSVGQKEYNDPAVPVNKAVENFKMPVKNEDAAQYQTEFYDPKASKEEQEAAMVVHNNTYQPNQGVDITMKDKKEFDVLAAMGGTVTKVTEDSLLGNVIEIQHDDGVVTQYQSVQDFKVNVGDQVKQGQVLAKAGKSLLNEEAGIHVHFEIRKDNVAVNPVTYFGKPTSAIEVVSKEDQVNSDEDQSKQVNEEEKSSDETKADDMQDSDDANDSGENSSNTENDSQG